MSFRVWQPVSPLFVPLTSERNPAANDPAPQHDHLPNMLHLPTACQELSPAAESGRMGRGMVTAGHPSYLASLRHSNRTHRPHYCLPDSMGLSTSGENHLGDTTPSLFPNHALCDQSPGGTACCGVQPGLAHTREARPASALFLSLSPLSPYLPRSDSLPCLLFKHLIACAAFKSPSFAAALKIPVTFLGAGSWKTVSSADGLGNRGGVTCCPAGVLRQVIPLRFA